jgi:flagellar hook-basal body complex protein FliE
MSLPILPVVPIIPPSTGASLVTPAATGGGDPFASLFSNAVHQVEAFQNHAKESVNRFLSGEGEDLHKVALASEQADLSFQLFMQVRNKVISAYQEIMKMQI